MAYTIKAACALLEIRVDTLRKWERRYNLVSPWRGKNAYREYSDLDLKRLSIFIRARGKGASGQDAARQAMCVPTMSAFEGDRRLERLAESAIDALDRKRLIDVCRRAEAEYGKACALTQVWIPLLSRLGERAIKQKGLEIAKEHFAVAILRERILKQNPAPGRSQVALMSPEGELHEIGMLALAQELQVRKLPYLYLGANLPAESLCSALAHAKVRRVIVCFTRRITRPALKALVRKIQSKKSGTIVYLGGSASLAHSNLIAELGGVFLGANLELGVDKLMRSIKDKSA